MLERKIADDRAAGLRPCVGLLVLHKKQILLGCRAGWHQVASWTDEGRLHIDNSVPEWKFALQIPQGGIEEGEDATRAFFRESLEEFGSIATAISEPEFIMRTEARFRLERDGIQYRGNSIYYLAVDVGYLSMDIGEWFDIFTDVDSDGVGPAYPTPGFPGGVHLYNHRDAVASFRAEHLGRKSETMIGVLDELLRRDLLNIDQGRTFSAINVPYAAALPQDDPYSLEAIIRMF